MGRQGVIGAKECFGGDIKHEDGMFAYSDVINIHGKGAVMVG